MNKQTNQSHANGIDSLSLTLILAAVVFLLLGKLAVFFFFLAALCLALGIWRGASRNLAARQAENYKFMGDTGSLLLGYVLATMSVLGLFKFYALVSFAVPVLAIAVPLFDTIFAFFRRLIHGQNPMETSIVSVTTLDDQEDVAGTLNKYDFLALPVVDTENRLVGIVTVDDAMA